MLDEAGEKNRGGEEAAWAEFYDQFELRFRGSYELIYERLASRYGQRLRELAGNPRVPPLAVDLGCGRGEFLDLAAAAGLQARGCDASDVAAAGCRSRGLAVASSDILAYLSGVASGSLGLVGFLHVIEHCPPAYSFQVFREAARCLAAGGVLLVETPSLYSLWAAGRQFFLDPTHLRPVHPEYIAFMAEYCGFRQTETLLFDEVEHPERGHIAPLSGEIGARLAGALGKWERWLYGPMDAGCWASR